MRPMMNLNGRDLERSYQVADRIMKDNSISFYTAFCQLSPESFKEVTALYAFCRQADDIVDSTELKSQVLARISRLEEVVGEIYGGGQDIGDDILLEFPWLPAFAHTIRTYKIPQDPFKLQLEGQKSDLDFEDIRDMEDLLDYSRKVAGSVGLMMLPILVEKNNMSEEVLAAGSDLGVAMQLTNILRDIGEDIRDRDRVYIPRSLMVKHGVSRKDFEDLAYERTHHVSRHIIALWEEIAAYSAELYQGILSHIKSFKKEAWLPLVSSALIYQGIEDSVRKNSYLCFAQRCYTSKLDRIKLIGKSKKIVGKING